MAGGCSGVDRWRFYKFNKTIINISNEFMCVPSLWATTLPVLHRRTESLHPDIMYVCQL